MSACDHEWIIDERDGDAYCSRCGVNVVDAPAEPAPTPRCPACGYPVAAPSGETP